MIRGIQVELPSRMMLWLWAMSNLESQRTFLGVSLKWAVRCEEKHEVDTPKERVNFDREVEVGRG
jgi:hypothetical protein